MGVELLTERHASQIAGVLGCYDRMLIFGTLPGICYAEGMTSFLYKRQVRIFDYPKFAEPFRERLRENAERMAAAVVIEVEFIRTRGIRKEDRAQELRAKRGEHPGLVCILPAMEPCSTYKPWHNKQSGKTYLVPNDGKCLHYYFYFVDEELGFCHVRVPTWLPCRLQICLNGHHWLAGQLRQLGIEYRMADNAFTHLGDWQKAQAISDGWEAKRIHDRLNELARLGGQNRYGLPGRDRLQPDRHNPRNKNFHFGKPGREQSSESPSIAPDIEVDKQESARSLCLRGREGLRQRACPAEVAQLFEQRWPGDRDVFPTTMCKYSNMNPGFLTVNQVAEQLQMHPHTVRLLLAAGKLPGTKVGGKEWRVPARALVILLDAQANAREIQAFVDELATG